MVATVMCTKPAMLVLVLVATSLFLLSGCATVDAASGSAGSGGTREPDGDSATSTGSGSGQSSSSTVQSSSSAGQSSSSSVSISDSSEGGTTINGSGRHRSEARSVGGFKQLALHGVGHLVLTQGERDTLTIEGDDNVLPVITSEVRGGVLHLGPRDGNTIRPSVPIVYRLTMRDIAGIQQEGLATVEARSIRSDDLYLGVRGSGSVQMDQVDARNLAVVMGGSGNVRLAGRTTDQRVDVVGASDYQADQLSSRDARVAIEGSGNCALQVAGNLDATIVGAGSITYAGAPSVARQIVGPGTVRPA